MRQALCPQAKRDNFFAELEQRNLRPEDDPSVYKLELEIILLKTDPSLLNDAKTALLTRQFSKGLPPTLKLKMLEHNPTPTLDEIVEFTQRFCALGCATAAEIPPVQVDAVSHSSDPQLKELFTMVAAMKTHKLPKPNLTQIQDQAQKKWLRHYDQYFLHDEILYRALGKTRNLHPQHVILIPSPYKTRFLNHCMMSH
jgi:hypothetical protein